MAFLFRKKVKGIYSLYMGENKKINGVSTRVKSKYLGPLHRFTKYFADELFKIEHINHYEYGLSSALKQIMDQFLFQKIFRNKIKKQTEDHYIDKLIVLMVMNRLTDPCAKYSLQRWFNGTDLANTFNAPIEELKAHKIYRAMDQLDKYAEEIETEICKTILIQENISLNMIYQIINHRLKKKGLDMSVQGALDNLKAITYYHIKIPGQDEPIKHLNPLTQKQKEILKALEVEL